MPAGGRNIFEGVRSLHPHGKRQDQACARRDIGHRRDGAPDVGELTGTHQQELAVAEARSQRTCHYAGPTQSSSTVLLRSGVGGRGIERYPVDSLREREPEASAGDRAKTVMQVARLSSRPGDRAPGRPRGLRPHRTRREGSGEGGRCALEELPDRGSESARGRAVGRCRGGRRRSSSTCQRTTT